MLKEYFFFRSFFLILCIFFRLRTACDDGQEINVQGRSFQEILYLWVFMFHSLLNKNYLNTFWCYNFYIQSWMGNKRKYKKFFEYLFFLTRLTAYHSYFSFEFYWGKMNWNSDTADKSLIETDWEFYDWLGTRFFEEYENPEYFQ